MEHKVVNDYTKSTSTGNDNIKVFVRARPISDGSEPPKEMWPQLPSEEGKIAIKDPESRKPGSEHMFKYDGVYWTEATQERMFQEVARPLVEHMLQGYNGCCFAYGQTGSGKTFTIFGDRGTKRGLIPRCVDLAFEHAEKQRRFSKNTDIVVSVSMLEMYCDEMRDLGRAYQSRDEKSRLGKSLKTSEWYLERLKHKQSFAASAGNDSFLTNTISQEAPLEIREDISGSVYVKNLSEIVVSKPEDVYEIVESGFNLRATHETRMNTQSSRSHTIFTLIVSKRDKTTDITVRGMLNLVDLAGSERLNKSESEGQRLKETLFINSSLSALGKVAASLDPSTPAGFIPYRDSKLTRILQSSMGGNSHTSIIATLHPTKNNYNECLGTLQFANRCRFVVNQPRINYTDAQGRNLLQETIRHLQAEIKRLRLTMAVVLARKNKQIEEILGKLGHEGARVLEDGRVQLTSGKIVGSRVDISSIERQVTLTQQKAAARAGSIAGSEGIASQSISEGFGMESIDQLLGGQGWNSPLLGGGQIPPDLMQDLHDGDLADLQVSKSELIKQLSGFGEALFVGLGGLGAAGTQKDLSLILNGEASPSASGGTFFEQGSMLGTFQTLHRENARLRDKLAKMKREWKDTETEQRKESIRTREETKRLREEVQYLKRQISEVQVVSQTKLTAQRHDFEGKLTAVVANSREIEQRTQEQVAMIPKALRVDSAKINAAKKQSERLEAALNRKHEEHIREIVRTHDGQLSNLKEQADYWINKKEQECKKFVDDFNRYHKRRTREALEYKKEMRMLYEHCNNLARVMNKVQAGEYRIKITNSKAHMFQEVCIKDRPDDSILTDKERLRMLKDQIRTLRNLEQTADGPISATPCPDVQIRPQTAQSDRTFETRPSSANTWGRPETPHYWAQTADVPPRKHSSSAQVLLEGAQLDGIDLDKNPQNMNSTELREMVNALKNFILTNQVEKVMEEKLSRGLSKDPTLTYIKTLEEGLQTYKESFRQEAESHKNLRIAFESLQRKKKLKNAMKK